ncbi:MAG: hypothetical protein HY551_04355 [Elusimicrobia bacterium]|nr:hypothetical protein [Elusimicrobiota bacterium]
MKKSEDNRVVIGVSGSIAAYKACEVLRGLSQEGVETRVVLTPNASRFVTPLTMGTLSGNPVYQDPYDPNVWEMAHLSLASWARLIVIVPATADLIARLAWGGAGGLLEGLVLAARSPVAVCPAMDAAMWEHPATRENVAKLSKFGYRIWGPVKGPLASGRTGMGRLLEPDEIVSRALAALRPKNPAARRPSSARAIPGDIAEPGAARGQAAPLASGR